MMTQYTEDAVSLNQCRCEKTRKRLIVIVFREMVMLNAMETVLGHGGTTCRFPVFDACQKKLVFLWWRSDVADWWLSVLSIL